MSLLLPDKVALITGAGRGIGRGIANVFAREGAAVVVGDIQSDLAQETASLISGQSGKSFPVLMDVTSARDIESAVQQTVDRFGKIDILVNNAGVVNLTDPFELKAEDFRRTMEINLIGAFLCCQAFAKKVVQLKSKGSIVNIASNAGKGGYRGMLDYSASKAALINLTRVMALELAPYGINVNAICPGVVNTGQLIACAEWLAPKKGIDVQAQMQAYTNNQLGRLIQPEEIGEVAAFLASDRAIIIRGQSINADTGNTIY